MRPRHGAIIEHNSDEKWFYSENDCSWHKISNTNNVQGGQNTMNNYDNNVPGPTWQTPYANAVAEARAERERVERRRFALDQLEAWDEIIESFTDGSILYFEKVSERKTMDDVTLRYAAVRSGNKWFFTGSTTPQGVTDEQAADFITSLGVAAKEVLQIPGAGDTLAYLSDLQKMQEAVDAAAKQAQDDLDDKF